MKVVAAMSGGVDSAVAAARMVDAGHEVVGVHLALSQNAATLRESARGCCTIEDAGDARRVADVLGIPFYVWDLAARFRADVVEDFLAEYAAGRTPNPCVRCNERIKFAALLDKAVALGFDAVATGHYAQVVERPDGRRELHRAADPRKDQSYVLGVLDEDQLARSFFPLGDTTKPQIREEAKARGFFVASKPDSHDICFIPDGDTRGFLTPRARRAARRAGRHRRPCRRNPFRRIRIHRRPAPRTWPGPERTGRRTALRRRGRGADQHRRHRRRRPARRGRHRRRPRALVRSGARGGRRRRRAAARAR